MGDTGSGYELKLLTMAVNKYLNESTSLSESSLRTLETDRDQVVWDLSTKLYSQSGHKVELTVVRDIVNLRIAEIRDHLASEQKHIAQKAMQVAEQEAKQRAESAHRAAKEEESIRAKITNVLPKFSGDETKAQIFIRVREIISEKLSVDENIVDLKSHLSHDLGADSDGYEVMELVLELEYEFDVEIFDDEVNEKLGVSSCSYSCNTNESSSSGRGLGGILALISASSAYSSYSSSSMYLDENCIVKSFVDLLYEKVQDSKEYE